jgi:hypothetical protein
MLTALWTYQRVCHLVPWGDWGHVLIILIAAWWQLCGHIRGCVILYPEEIGDMLTPKGCICTLISLPLCVGSAWQGRDIEMHPKTGQSLVSLHSRSCGVYQRNNISKQNNWRVCVGFTMLTPYVSICHFHTSQKEYLNNDSESVFPPDSFTCEELHSDLACWFGTHAL